MMKWPVNFHPLHTWCKSSIKYGWIFTLSILEGSSVPKVKRVHWAWTCWYCQPFCLIHQCQIEEEKRSGQTLYKVEKWVVCSRWPLYSAHTSTKNNNDQVIRNHSLSLSLSLEEELDPVLDWPEKACCQTGQWWFPVGQQRTWNLEQLNMHSPTVGMHRNLFKGRRLWNFWHWIWTRKHDSSLDLNALKLPYWLSWH